MASVRQLNKEDILFVAGESSDVYQHTAGLVILDTSDCPEFSFEYLKEKVIERINKVPHFRWKLHEVPLGLDMPYWVEDEQFSYDNHFKRIGVPSPGDREALAEVVAHLYSKHLDRNRPLWEFWFIEGLADGKYAILQKLHHCMMDGQGASKLGELLCDFEPNARARPIDAAIRNARAGEIPDWFRMSTTTARHMARLTGTMYRQVFDMVGSRVLEGARLKKSPAKKPKPEMPLSRFNGDIGSDRGFVFESLSLTDIKTVRKAMDATVNDVLLAIVSTALRNYLQHVGELPDLPLRTGVPVSLRTDDDEISNRVTQVSVSLATDIADPVKRLQTISSECKEAKQLAHSGEGGMIEILQILPPWAVTAMMGITTPEQATQMLNSNLIVSNVRGSDRPMYIAGARLQTMYPMSIITAGLGINFTCVSYAEQVDIGIAIEPHLVPEPWLIIDGMQDALDEYLELARKATRPKRKAMTGAKAKAKTKAKTKAKRTSGKTSAAGKNAPIAKRAARKKTAPRKTRGAA